MHEYDLIAEWYASNRDDQTGVAETIALASSLPRGSLVLDIGCGNGIPITQALLRRGHKVLGLDSSSVMLARFRQNCPEAFAVRGLVQSCPFLDDQFDGAVAWGVLFHLPIQEAIQAIANVARILKPGAPFLFTSGNVDDSGAKTSEMNGVTFRYFSCSADRYRDILRELGLRLVDVHEDRSENTYYLATRNRAAAPAA